MDTKLIFAFVILHVFEAAVGEAQFPSIFRKCYGELGCFSIGTDFMDLIHRPIQVLPADRDEINTKFRLYTRLSGNNGHEIKAHDTWLLEQASFVVNKSVVFIIHGFLEDATAQWVYSIRRDLLIRDNINVIEVNWGQGADPPYTQATANTRLVGAEVALMLRFLDRNLDGFELNNVHLVGHSLGAHISGYAGKQFVMNKIGRITGLDPAGPYFEGTKAFMRLDRHDAKFVEVIHTNGVSIFKKGFGMYQPVGDVDIYVNGGVHQIGCGISKSITNLKDRGLVETFACSHMRVVHLFRASILAECPFRAFRCSDYETFKAGRCLNCSEPNSCIRVGYYPKEVMYYEKLENAHYYLDTGDKPPFCGYHYGITINFAPTTRSYKGRFYVNFENNLGSIGEEITIPSADSWSEISPSTNVSSTHFFKIYHGEVESLIFRWERKLSLTDISSWLGGGVVKISSIDVFDAVSQRTRRFCSHVELRTKKDHSFIPC